MATTIVTHSAPKQSTKPRQSSVYPVYSGVPDFVAAAYRCSNCSPALIFERVVPPSQLKTQFCHKCGRTLVHLSLVKFTTYNK